MAHRTRSCSWALYRYIRVDTKVIRKKEKRKMAEKTESVKKKKRIYTQEEKEYTYIYIYIYMYVYIYIHISLSHASAQGMLSNPRRSSPYPTTFKNIHLSGYEILSGSETTVGVPAVCVSHSYVNCSKHIAQVHFNRLAKRWHTIIWRRMSRCSARLIQDAGSHRWAPQVGARCQQTPNVCKCVY